MVKGRNDVIVFGLQGKMGAVVRGLDKPVLGSPTKESPVAQ